MSDETVDPFRRKIMRMFFPSRIRKKQQTDSDLETIDPLERFEKAIKKDAEAKHNKRKNLGND